MKFPWKNLAVGCGILTALVAVRCVVTVERAIFYGRSYGFQLVMQDPWFYIGMASAAICVAALLVLVDRASKRDQREDPGDSQDPQETE